MTRKYGLNRHEPFTPEVKLRDLLTDDVLPTAASLPAKFGHDNLIPNGDWGIDLNQLLGDCFIAGGQHTTMLLNAEAGRTVTFTDRNTVTNYSAATGYVRGAEIEGFNDDGSAIINPDAGNLPPNSTDQGIGLAAAFDFWTNTGFVDADGNTHKIIAHAALTPGDWDELLVALDLFTVVNIGIAVPDYAEQQFDDGQPWTVLPGRHKLVGGHFIDVVARDGALVKPVTWGKETGMDAGFYKAFNLGGAVVFTEEMLTNGKTIDGLDEAKLQALLPQLNTGQLQARKPKAASVFDFNFTEVTK